MVEKEKAPYQEYLETLLKGLVNHPEEVKTEKKVDEMGVLLTIKLHPEDVGIIIGRQGTVIRAIRTLIKVIGLKHHARVNLKIVEVGEKKEGKGGEIEELKL